MAPSQPNATNGVSLENVAEEVLNGIFCHYEPPTSQDAQRRAAEEAIQFPNKFESQARKKSILRPSRLVRKQKAQTLRSVTWRDEQQKSNPIESRISACAMDQCNLFGNSTGDGIADTHMPSIPTQLQSVLKKKTPVTAPLMPASPAPLKPTSPTTTEEPQKKVLYDDEGNPIDAEGDEKKKPQDENMPPSPKNLQDQSQYYRSVPFGRPGDEIPMDDEDIYDPGVYEPEMYGRSPSSNEMAYKRMRSPPVPIPTRNYRLDEEDELEPEHKFLERVGKVPPSREHEFVERVGKVPPSREHEFVERVGKVPPSREHEFVERVGKVPPSRVRSKSPSRRRRSENGYYEVVSNRPTSSPRESKRRLGWMKKLAGRPSTPYGRHRSKDSEEFDSDDDVARLGEPSRDSSQRGRSSIPRGYGEYEDYNDERVDDPRVPRRGRRSRSPGRRSDAFSDLTEDVSDALFDRYDTPPRRRSRSPGRRDYYPMDDPYFYERRRSPQRRDFDYDERDYEDGLRFSRTRDFDEEERPYRREHNRRSSREYYDDIGDSEYYDDVYYRRGAQEYEDVYDRRRSEREEYRHEGGFPESQDDADGRVSPTPGRKANPEEEREPYETRRGYDRRREDDYDYQRRYDAKARRSRRESDPIPNRRSRRREIYTDEDENDIYAHKRPHTTTSAEFRRGPLPLNTSHGEDKRRNRDPTPRMSIEAQDAPEFSENRAELPPTPRLFGQEQQPTRDDQIERVARPPQDEVEDYGRPTIDASHEEKYEEKFARTQRTLMRQLSPISLATDDELREEVSSVGMRSDTIRPLNFPNPFLQVPPPILEESAMNAEYSDREQSTLSSAQRSKTSSTLSSKRPTPTHETTPTHEKATHEKSEHPQHPQHSRATQPPSQSSSRSSGGSGSGSSKKYWKGWRKSFGKVKNIVNEIDEKRIPPPFISKETQ